MFLAPKFFGGSAPEFLESIYKIDTGSDHVAKFRGDRPRELGDYALKKRKHHEHFISPPVTPYGRPNNDYDCGESARHLVVIMYLSAYFSQSRKFCDLFQF